MNRSSSAQIIYSCLLAFGCSSAQDGAGAQGGKGSGAIVVEMPGIGAGSGNGSGSGSGTPINPGSGSGTGSGAGTSTGGSGPTNACQPRVDGQGCVGEQFAGESVPLDVYILFDQSCSMSCPISRTGGGQCCTGDPNGRIIPVRQAMDAFLHAPESAAIGFGLGYFGYQALGQASCDPQDFATPDVTIGTGQADAIVASLNQAKPTGETPTGAALRGACGYAKQAKRERPSRSVVILLVTDGIPETPVSNCGATLPDAVQAATECAGDGEVPIKTYVLGVGQALSNLNQIAKAGGTQAAQLVEGGDVAQAMLAALNKIRGDAAIPCELVIPPPPAGGLLDTSQVNLGICDAAGVDKPTYNVEGPDKCGSGAGWYYDNPSNPQKIVLCGASCETVTVPGAQLYYSVGCATQVSVR